MVLSAGVIVIEAVLILALLWVNLAGQPAGLASNLAQISTQQTRIAVLNAALPTPTVARCPTYMHC